MLKYRIQHLMLTSCQWDSKSKARENFIKKENFDTHAKYQPLNDVYPYKEYVGRKIHLSRNTPLYIKFPTNHVPMEFYLDGSLDTEPYQLREGSYVTLPKGWPLHILNVYSAYQKITFRKTEENPSEKKNERNSIEAEVELDLPAKLAKNLGLKNSKIKAMYC